MQTEASEGNFSVFMPLEQLARINAKREAGNWEEHAPVFDDARRDFRRILQTVKMQHMTHHNLRRAYISDWARRLLPAVVQKLAGHKDIQSTMKFCVLVLGEDLAKAREAAAEALRPRVHATCSWTQFGRKHDLCPAHERFASTTDRLGDGANAFSLTAPGRTRTCGRRIRNPMLCPLSYGGCRSEEDSLCRVGR